MRRPAGPGASPSTVTVVPGNFQIHDRGACYPLEFTLCFALRLSRPVNLRLWVEPKRRAFLVPLDFLLDSPIFELRPGGPIDEEVQEREGPEHFA